MHEGRLILLDAAQARRVIKEGVRVPRQRRVGAAQGRGTRSGVEEKEIERIAASDRLGAGGRGRPGQQQEEGAGDD